MLHRSPLASSAESRNLPPNVLSPPSSRREARSPREKVRGWVFSTAHTGEIPQKRGVFHTGLVKGKLLESVRVCVSIHVCLCMWVILCIYTPAYLCVSVCVHLFVSFCVSPFSVCLSECMLLSLSLCPVSVCLFPCVSSEQVCICV